MVNGTYRSACVSAYVSTCVPTCVSLASALLMSLAVVSLAVVSLAVVSLAVVSLAVVSLAVVSLAVVSLAVVSLAVALSVSLLRGREAVIIYVAKMHEPNARTTTMNQEMGRHRRHRRDRQKHHHQTVTRDTRLVELQPEAEPRPKAEL